MTGFGLKLWDGLSFGAIWMNAAMDPNHPEAKKAKKLHSFAADAMAQALRLNLALGPQLMELAARHGAQQERDEDASRDAAQGEQDQADLRPCQVEARPISPCRSRAPPSACSVPNATSTSTILARKAIPSLRRPWASSTPACPTRRPPCQSRKPFRRRRNIDPGRLPPVALAHAVDRARLRRSRRQGLQQHQRRAADRMEGQAAAVRRRRRMGRRASRRARRQTAPGT